MDIWKRLLDLELIKRSKDEEDEIFESLTEKTKNYTFVKNEYMELYANVTDLMIAVHQVQTVLKVSDFLNNEIPSCNQITVNDERKIAKILCRPYFHYLPEINLSNIEKITINTKLIPQIHHYIERNKYLLNNIMNIVKKVEGNMKTIGPLTLNCLIDYFKIEFI